MHERQSDGALPLAPASVSVHVGISWTEYGRLATNHGAGSGPYSALGAVLSVAAGRLSYQFGFGGPSVAYGTLPLHCPFDKLKLDTLCIGNGATLVP